MIWSTCPKLVTVTWLEGKTSIYFANADRISKLATIVFEVTELRVWSVNICFKDYFAIATSVML